MANVWARDRATWFYLGLGLWGLSAVLVGFSTTYALPMARGTFAAPPVVHIHGVLSLCWVSLLIVQTMLVRSGRTALHRKSGLFGVPVAFGIVLSGIGVALWAARRDLPAFGPVAVSSIVGTITSLSIFLILVCAGGLMARQPDWHKRLMLLATFVVLWPAFFRFRHLLPFVPRPEIWLALVLADLPIVIAVLRDKLVYGKVHPVWAWFGSLVVAEQSVELLVFDSPAWRAAGTAIYELLG